MGIIKSKLIFEEFIFKLNQANMFSEDKITFILNSQKVDVLCGRDVDSLVETCINLKKLALASV